MQKSPLKQIYLFFLLAALFYGCNNSKKPDVSHIDVQVEILRFDQDFDKLGKTPNMAAQAWLLQQKYGSFYTDYVEHVLAAGNSHDTAYFSTLRKVFAGSPYQDLKHDVDSVFPDLSQQNAQLTDAFRRIKYYFPQQRIPKVYAYFSGFQAQTTIGNDYFAIGLDMFLGADSRFYPAIINAYPRYVTRRFTPAYIAPKVVEGFLREEMFTEPDSSKNLLDKMIYNGKILYLMDKILPDAADTLKIGYTTQQLIWCEDFKAQIWGLFVEQNLLYQTDLDKITKYINEAPFTPGLAEHNNSAPRLAVWTGWQIVRQYMDNHPEVTLPQLMHITDPQIILNNAHYHPK